MKPPFVYLEVLTVRQTLNSHPDLEQLRSFSLGKLDDESASARVEAHIETCADCRQTLQTLTGDTLERLVRGADATTLEPRRDADETIPACLEYFRIEKVFGQGGMGTVYLASDTRLQRQVAIKTLKRELAQKPHARDRFLREARAAAALAHDHVVPIYYVGEAEGIPFLAMPVLKGMSLDESLRQAGGKLPIAACVKIASQIADGLAAAHRRGLIHRDIKPSNIWIEPEQGGRVKILDFGLAKAVDADEDLDLTQPGAIVGTAAYMSPEQAGGLRVDGRADLFSLGCVLYQMLTGRRPFGGDNIVSILKSLAVDTPAEPASLNPQCPADLSRLVSRLLEKDPASRPASAEAVHAALAEFAPAAPGAAAGQGAATGRPGAGIDALAATVSLPGTCAAPAPRPAPRPSRRLPRRPPLVAVCAGLLGLVPLAYFFGGTVIRFAANQGELVVEVEDSNVEIRIVQDGVEVQDKTSQRTFTLKAGQGEIEVFEQDGVGPLATRQFALNRGGKTTVRVTYQDLAGGRKPEPPTPSPSEVAVEGDPDRRAAEWVLSIGGTVGIDDRAEGIQSSRALPKGAYRLTSVYLNGNAQVTDAGLANFKDCKNLAVLALESTGATDAGLAHFQHCENLTHLNLDHTQATDAGLAHFQDCKNLTGLGLSQTQVTDAGLAHFQDCENLTSLVLFLTRVTDAGLAHFRDCENLTSLDLYGTQVTDAGLAHFQHRKNLTQLNLSNTQVSDAGLAHFQDCKTLTYLNLAATQVSDAGLAHFQDCNNLTQLHLSNTQATDAGLAHFQDCKNLEHLYLDHTQATDAGLAHFQHCKNLTNLHLSNTQVTDAGLAHFQDCKNLTLLSLSNTRVTDAGLAHFQHWENLTELNLSYTRVTDAGLKHFAALPVLASVDLTNSRVSALGFATLKAAMPQAQLTWSEPNRTAAEAALALGGGVWIRVPGGAEELRPHAPADLPDGSFQVTRVTLVGVEGPVGDVLARLAALVDPEFDRFEALDLDGTAVRRPDLDSLKDLPNLVELRLGCSTVTDLVADRIGALTRLKRLSLAGSRIGDAGLKGLTGLTNLEALDLRQTQATAAGVAELQAALPKCKIESGP